MRRSSFISILSRYKHSLGCHNPYNSYIRTITGISHYDSLISAAQNSRNLYFGEVHLLMRECSTLYFSIRNYSSEGVTSNLIGEDFDRVSVEEERVVHGADELYKTISENRGFDKDMEKALEQEGSPLTTESVMEVLHRLRFDEKLAFRFFMWAGQNEHYRHEYQVYNEMIDILSSTTLKSKQYRIVCDMLDYMKRNNKKSVPVDILLTILKKYTEKHLTEIKKCSKKKKRLRVKAQPEVNALNLLLEALCKCGLVEAAETLFKKVRSKIDPDATTFNTLFFGWCRVRKPKRGMRIMEEMTDMGFAPDIFTYNAAIDSFSKTGMVNEAYELFNFMRMKGSASSPTAKTYVIMILALVEHNRMEDCFKIVGDMIQSGCVPDVSTYKGLIEGMCLAGKVDEAYCFLEEMAKKGFPPDVVTYNCFLKVLCDNKMSSEALKLYGKMVETRCMPSVHTFNMLIEMFFAMEDPDGAFETWEEMNKRACDRDINTYCVMIEGLFGCGRVDDACLLIEDIVNLGMKLPYKKFDSFLLHLSSVGNLRAIHILSEHMKRFYNPGMARRFALSQKRKSLSLREN